MKKKKKKREGMIYWYPNWDNLYGTFLFWSYGYVQDIFSWSSEVLPKYVEWVNTTTTVHFQNGNNTYTSNKLWATSKIKNITSHNWLVVSLFGRYASLSSRIRCSHCCSITGRSGTSARSIAAVTRLFYFEHKQILPRIAPVKFILWIYINDNQFFFFVVLRTLDDS